MRHRKVTSGKLGRTTAHRKALMRNMATSLFEYESIITTISKAKALKRYSEKIITLVKKDTPHAYRLVFQEIKRKDIIKKLFETIKTRFADRPGGYTRIYHLYPRKGDNAEMVKIELLSEKEETPAKETKTKKTAKTRKSPGAAKKEQTQKTTQEAVPVKQEAAAKEEKIAEKEEPTSEIQAAPDTNTNVSEQEIQEAKESGEKDTPENPKA